MRGKSWEKWDTLVCAIKSNGRHGMPGYETQIRKKSADFYMVSERDPSNVFLQHAVLKLQQLVYT